MSNLSNTKIIVQYIGTNSFIEQNKLALIQNNGNFGDNQYIHLSFPVGKFGDGVHTGLSKEEAEKIENSLGREKGSISNTRHKFLYDYKAQFNKTVPTMLDLNIPQQYLQYKCLLSQPEKYIYKKSELRDKPSALFLITDEALEITETNTRGENKRKAYRTYDSLSPIDMRNILTIKGEFGIQSLADEAVRARVFDLLENDPVEFLEIVEEAKEGIKVDIEDMVRLGIIDRNGTNGKKYLIAETGETLGIGKEQVVEYFKNPDNAENVILLKNKLQNQKNLK